MKIVHSWLNDLVAVGDDVAAIEDAITHLGLAVEEVAHVGATVPGVVTAKVLRTARSLYAAAQVCVPPSHQVELQEHFRCAPEIIGFNNELAYARRIKPLRLSPSLPQVVRRTLVDGRRERDVNDAQARAIAQEVAHICGRTGPWSGQDTGTFTIGSIPTISTGLKKYKKAVEELERAVDLAGDDPTITEHLGDAYKKIGKNREAHQLYQDALSKAKETDQVERLKDKLQVLRDDGRAAQ